MKTCKDCYHFDACVDKLGTTKFYDNVIAANNVEDLCPTFKDNSLVLDLPCKVGDTVYMPWKWNDRNGIGVLTVTHIIRDSLKKYIKTDFYTDDEDYYNAYNCGNFGFDEVGVIVFTHIKEAEHALKELNNEQ